MKAFVILMLVFCGANADKVISGSAAAPNQFPSIVFQEKSGSFFCGGTIISANRVLTAAHCEQNLIGLTVTAGTTTRNSGGVTKSVNDKVVHPQYSSQTTQNDVMILYLSSSFTFNNAIAAATMVQTTPAAGTAMTVAGWGDTNPGIMQNLPNDLQYNPDVAVIATSTCNGFIGYNGGVLSGMMCIGTMAGGEDTCQGDSGGPAYVGTSSNIAGITSWGYGCAQQNKPGVYTDVAYYYSWITKNM